ncbi:hypothetical protein L2E82_20295 [Cichorium intybus]|uniref:Uncharacterized protein n=1 Tax=Cichorium intybus TaxID=13427 RepID=A0ACB9DSJ5_CICIN|nr:hypothetical protein L2E82_20295 [Cichorium intybus]
MASLPCHLNIGDGSLVCIKNVGGLNVALCFKNHSMAKEFLEDTDRWIEWFQWMVLGDSKDFGDDRIAWVNVMGLPMRLWSEDNLSSIIKPFRTIIVPSEDLEPHFNSSVIRVGILTRYRRWLNDEVAVSEGGRHFNIGVVEFERNWSPFSFKSDENCDDDDFSDEDGGDEEIDEDEDDDILSECSRGLEEGKILAESIDGKTVSAGGIDSGMEVSADVPETVDVPESSELGDNLIDNNCFRRHADDTCNPIKNAAVDDDCLDGPGGAGAQIRDSDPPCNMTGPNGLSLPPNCFGPFPSSFPPRPGSPSVHRQDEMFTASGPCVIRRNFNRAEHRFSPYRCYSQPTRVPARLDIMDPLPILLRLILTTNPRMSITSEVIPAMKIHAHPRLKLIGLLLLGLMWGLKLTETTPCWPKSLVNLACWNDSEFDCEGVNANGRSGGLMSIWNKDIFKKTEVIKGQNYLIVIGEWKNIDGKTIFVNIYGPQSPSDKRALWSKILEFINKIDVLPLFTISYPWRVFMISIWEVLNSPTCRVLGAKLSKLDRFLVCSRFLSFFPSTVVTTNPRELSDHCPVSLTSCADDFDAPYFKFFNSWLLKDGIDDVVTDACSKFRGYDPPDKYLAAKLKFIKQCIRKWRADAHKKESSHIEMLRSKIADLEKLAELRSLSDQVLGTGPGTRSGNTLSHTQTHENKTRRTQGFLRGSDSVQILRPRATTREILLILTRLQFITLVLSSSGAFSFK